METQYFTGGWNRSPLDGKAKWAAGGTFIELALSSSPKDIYFLLGFVEKKTYLEFSERLNHARGRP